MNIEEHFDLLLDKYELRPHYIKYLALSILTTTLKESFYWLLIYFAEKVKNEPEMITKYAILLLGTFGLNIPVERQFNHSKTELMKEIKLANNKYFNELCRLEMAACEPQPDVKDALNELRLIKSFIDAAKAKVEQCNDLQEGIELLFYAQKRLQKYASGGCMNC